MALDFPSSPTDGQAYQGYVYSSSVGAWQAKPSAQSPFYTSDTPPSNPVAGDSWFNTNDGTLYVYYYDGNTYQWVEHRSQIAKNQVGLVPIVPTSVAVGSGTATVSSNGLIAYSGASSVSINGVFSSQFNNYRLLWNVTTVASQTNTQKVFRLRTTSDESTSVYYYGGQYTFVNGTTGAFYSSNSGTTQAQIGWLDSGETYGSSIVDFIGPNLTTHTVYGVTSMGRNSSAAISLYGNGLVYSSTAFTGVSLFGGTPGTTNGTIKIYGYN